MSPTIVEHRHIERSISRKRWTCRECLSSDRLRSVGRWGVGSLRATPSGQSLWHCPESNCHGDDCHTSIDRWTDALSSQRHRINFAAKSKKRQSMNGKENNVALTHSSDIGRRQIPKHCESREGQTDAQFHFSQFQSVPKNTRREYSSSSARSTWWSREVIKGWSKCSTIFFTLWWSIDMSMEIFVTVSREISSPRPINDWLVEQRFLPSLILLLHRSNCAGQMIGLRHH